MVTSTKAADDKVVAMSTEVGTGGGVPPRTLLEEVNAHLTCVLCRGYYIDATTIVECLHSFCRSCIVKHLQTKKYCPVCEMMINAAKPNIKPDKALQDIVYKLVPGLFQREMERRRQFYSSRPGPAAATTPEQRGEDTERIIFSPEDVISFSLEYAEVTDTESVSSRSSESGSEAPTTVQQTRRYLQCPAVVNICHLKKFLSMKFDIDCSHFCIDILYKRVSLLDYYTLMDIAYIYNWKRNEPMRFFYQIIDYSAMRSRFGLFDINRKGSHFRDSKSSPTPTEDTNASSPAAPLNDHSSEGTSGTNSPMPDDSNNFMSLRSSQEKTVKNLEKNIFQSKLHATTDDSSLIGTNSTKSTDSSASQEVDVEKSQFLNSFELTAKNSSGSPTKNDLDTAGGSEKINKDVLKSSKLSLNTCSPPKIEDSTLKRRVPTPPQSADPKKQKSDQDKRPDNISVNSPVPHAPIKPFTVKNSTVPVKKVEEFQKKNIIPQPPTMHSTNPTQAPKPVQPIEKPGGPNPSETTIPFKQPVPSEQPLKRTYSSSQSTISPKRKSTNDHNPTLTQVSASQSSPMKPLNQSLPMLNPEGSQTSQKRNEPVKPNLKKLPDLKLNIPNPNMNKNKPQPIINRGIRTDLLANNSDPITDRSKILSQVKRSLTVQSPSDKSQTAGDPLKSLFDSCKINIPSSLSITLTDQKLEPRNVNDSSTGSDTNKFTNKNSPLNGSGNFTAMKSPTPAVQNSIEILKLPDPDPTKPIKSEAPNPPATTQSTKPVDSPSTPSAKGPVPSLKPISDTKIGKQQTFTKPSPTFHQIFIQSLQSQQPDKSKSQKNKAPVPKLMPANPKVSSENNRNESSLNTPSVKNLPENKNIANLKSDSVLDLSTPHTVQSQLGPHQTKLLETMQSIANLAKKQNLSSKPASAPNVSPFPHSTNKPLTNIPTPLRIPIQSNQNKPKLNSPASPSAANIPRLDALHSNKGNLFRPALHPSSNCASLANQSTQQSVSPAQPSPRSQTRSPSLSPKLVIAEERQTPLSSDSVQSNPISSSQVSSTNAPKIDLAAIPQSSAGPSKTIKLVKPPAAPKLSSIRFPGSISKPSSSAHPVAPGNEMLHSLAPQILAQQQAFIRQQFDMQSLGHMLPATTEWLNKFNQARQIESLYKSLSDAQQAQNDFSGKDNKK